MNMTIKRICGVCVKKRVQKTEHASIIFTLVIGLYLILFEIRNICFVPYLKKKEMIKREIRAVYFSVVSLMWTRKSLKIHTLHI